MFACVCACVHVHVCVCAKCIHNHTNITQMEGLLIIMYVLKMLIHILQFFCQDSWCEFSQTWSLSTLYQCFLTWFLEWANNNCNRHINYQRSFLQLFWCWIFHVDRTILKKTAFFIFYESTDNSDWFITFCKTQSVCKYWLIRSLVLFHTEDFDITLHIILVLISKSSLIIKKSIAYLHKNACSKW